jgi:hypothetical protein
MAIIYSYEGEMAFKIVLRKRIKQGPVDLFAFSEAVGVRAAALKTPEHGGEILA